MALGLLCCLVLAMGLGPGALALEPMAIVVDTAIAAECGDGLYCGAEDPGCGRGGLQELDASPRTAQRPLTVRPPVKPIGSKIH
jgi:hypothetical protein